MMSMTSEAQKEQELEGPEARGGEGIGAFGPIHSPPASASADWLYSRST
jgi:hypothetical protein